MPSKCSTALVWALLLTLVACSKPAPPPEHEHPAPRPSLNAIVVGAGIAGLSAAWELARGGAHVVVVDMASVPGGHAVMATGDLCIVGTPFEAANGVTDTPELAEKDFLAWGEDANPDWVHTYVNSSRREIYDWVSALGVTFESLAMPPGNSVRRTHRTKGRGLALISAVYSACAKEPDLSFTWNTRVDRLLSDGKRITGVAATNVRTKQALELHANLVVLATGGFQSNLDLVRQNWPSGLTFPEHLLIGSGINSTGSGLELAHAAGAALTRLDHQWNYITGLRDPRFPGSQRGLNAYDVDSIWVNAQAKRFIAERSSAKFGLPIVIKQPGGTYWSIFDEPSKKSFWIAGSDWGDFKVIDQVIFGNKDLVKSASTLRQLAVAAGLPPAALVKTVQHYNDLIAKGRDTDFDRFGPGKAYQPKKLGTPPFYAVQFFPLTRKSMGGVAIDSACRVLDAQQRVIAGLYAAGELSGLAGINGKAGLEGTFLGPSIVTGRSAGRAALSELGLKPDTDPVLPNPTLEAVSVSPEASTERCLSCHDLPKLTTLARPGYWHFERVHTQVLAAKYECTKCHAELSPSYQPEGHHIDRQRQIQVCATCHKGEDR